ncbi:MAG: putative molybdenum carrier protein [Patescibacteria group bacterium]
MISKIISGGQTGVDRAALDFAIKNNIAHSGFCPKGRRSEDGIIPDKYNLTETDSPDYLTRTAMNVKNSDGTLIITRGNPEGGTRETINLCIRNNKPKFIISSEHKFRTQEFFYWVKENNIATLNVAGPRESKQPGIARHTNRVLTELFTALAP